MNLLWREKDKTLEAFFAWASTISTENDCFFVDLPDSRGYYYFEFPLKYGDKPRRRSSLPDQKEVTFVLRIPQKQRNVNGSWVCIFVSPHLQILENKNRVSGVSPVRWKLNEDEKNRVLKIARDSLEESLNKNSSLSYQYFASLPSRFFPKMDLAVALWVKGSLRGSIVLENTQLGEGVAKAVVSASRDKRFKPLSIEELSDTRIEVTILQSLRLPISPREIKENVIDAGKGYCLIEGMRKGWFLPEVFNVRRFLNLEQLIDNLAKEKAGLLRTPVSPNVFHFEVDDFIESLEGRQAISLKGPVPNTNTPKDLLELAEKSADWLIRNQESDGNFPAVSDPFTGRAIRQLDWPRLAFTAWTLAEFGKVSLKKQQYKEGAEKVFFYLKRHIFDQQYEVSNRILTLAYFGNLCLALDRKEDAVETYNSLEISHISFEPILFAQLASFLKKISSYYIAAEKLFVELSTTLKKEFEYQVEKKEAINLASWAELVNTFADTDQEFSVKVADWIKSQQLSSGAFPESTRSDFVYTRGTGKIFEVLALNPLHHSEALGKVLAWLTAMQYNENSMYFIPQDYREKINGAFRHDFLNPEAWIDAAGHVLLGSARLLSQNYEK